MNDGNQEQDIDNPWTQQLMKFGDWYAIFRILFLYLPVSNYYSKCPNLCYYSCVIFLRQQVLDVMLETKEYFFITTDMVFLSQHVST